MLLAPFLHRSSERMSLVALAVASAAGATAIPAPSAKIGRGLPGALSAKLNTHVFKPKGD